MIFTSQIVTGVSGSVGGLTGSHNKGGMYFKGKAAPTNPNSSRQQATRNQLGTFASAWTNVLAQGSRDLWNDYAQIHTIKNSLGEDIFINGINWYIMFNTRLQDAGEGLQTDPPLFAGPGGFVTFSVDVSAATTGDVTFTGVLGADELIQLWMTIPGTTGQTPNFKQARLVGYSALAEVSPWAATLPFAVAGDKQTTFYGRTMNNHGQVSVASVHTDIADY